MIDINEVDAVRIHGMTIKQIDLLRQFYIQQSGDSTLVKLKDYMTAAKSSQTEA